MPASAAPSEELPDLLVLAAIARAERHNERKDVPLWSIKEHLGIPPKGRYFRQRLHELETKGLISRSHNGRIWILTAAARRRLSIAKARNQLPQLPESPQHRSWRIARDIAEAEISQLREDAEAEVEKARTLLQGQPSSDEVFDSGQRLEDALYRLASAKYCLTEWAEPSDDKPDVDAGFMTTVDSESKPGIASQKVGRRRVASWSSSPSVMTRHHSNSAKS